ncbi:hypothetical protein DPMN_151495 [Dreissena polymorpha]|uniref:Uncharacterized protein n=1 Tax=Dreissena polymorpha TaxID=45954 RepID=A0A9D4FFP6_DREPO|nr:hypothetical protein DPMN_151495 [Dreissena polymorpha]
MALVPNIELGRCRASSDIDIRQKSRISRWENVKTALKTKTIFGKSPEYRAGANVEPVLTLTSGTGQMSSQL